MAFKGHLEDLSIVEVLQLLHLARREGVLQIESSIGSASLVLKNGYLIGANHPSKEMKVGRILVELGVVDPDQIDSIVDQQKTSKKRTPLITSLIEQGAIEKEIGWTALERLIEETVVEIVSWKKGTFSFELGTVDASDDFQHFPQAEVFREAGLDIQHTLAEAMLILDERKRALLKTTISGDGTFPGVDEFGDERHSRPTLPVPSVTDEGGARKRDTADLEVDVRPSQTDFDQAHLGNDKSSKLAQDSALAALQSETEDSLLSRPYTARKALLFCRDAVFKNVVVEESEKYDIDIFCTAYEPALIERLRTYSLQGLAPIVIVDLVGKSSDVRWQQRGQMLITRMSTSFPETSLIALGEPDCEALENVLSKGARTVIPRKERGKISNEYKEYASQIAQIIFKCINGILQHRGDLLKDIIYGRKQITMLKKRVQEFKFRGESPEISLIVLKYLADFVDRCVIFLVSKSHLIGLGAFGINEENEDQSETVMQIKVPISDGSVVSTCLQDGQVFLGKCDDHSFQSALYRKIGKPKSSLVVLLPLKAGSRKAALIYGDFGVREPTPLLADALEILALHAGLALELALLRRSKTRATTTPPNDGSVSQIKRKSWLNSEEKTESVSQIKKVPPHEVLNVNKPVKQQRVAVLQRTSKEGR